MLLMAVLVTPIENVELFVVTKCWMGSYSFSFWQSVGRNAGTKV